MISVVIPTLNRPDYLISCVNQLLEQSYKDIEIIIVDQSDPEIHQQLTLVLTNEKVRLFFLEERSASKARNVGLGLAQGEITLFLDDDVIIVDSDFLSRHYDNFINSSIPGVSGAILDETKNFRNERHRLSLHKKYGWLFFPINFAQKCEIGNGWAGNLSVKTEYAKAVGGMDERYEKGAFREESDFCTRLVKKYGMMVYDPRAALVHLGAGSGGLRSFSTKNSVKAQHHFDGFFYYTFRNVSILYWWAHFLSFFMIFFRKNNFSRPANIITTIFRTLKAPFNAIKMMIAGPLYYQYENHSVL